MKLFRLLGAVIGAVALAFTGAVAASAEPVDQPCPYPFVCFYAPDGHITGRFTDVTSYYQTVDASRGADHMVNTRHDDTVYIQFTDFDFDSCVDPGSNLAWGPQWAAPVAVRISDVDSCTI